MNALELLCELTLAGVRLEFREDKLRFHPRSAVGPRTLGMLMRHKAEIAGILSELNVPECGFSSTLTDPSRSAKSFADVVQPYSEKYRFMTGSLVEETVPAVDGSWNLSSGKEVILDNRSSNR